MFPTYILATLVTASPLLGCSDDKGVSEEVITPAATSTQAPGLNTPQASGSSPTALPGYPCEEGSACVCGDFQVQAEAQRIFDKHGIANWAGLDLDGDGTVCDELP